MNAAHLKTAEAVDILFDGSDICVFKYPGNEGTHNYKNAYINLSAWSSTGKGGLFSPLFMKKRSIPSYWIVQKRNHWWHTPEIHTASELIRADTQNRNLGRILYGASMGAYGAAHLREMFDSSWSIALSPQLTVIGPTAEFESRWKQERAAITPIFDEVSNFNGQATRNLTIITDLHHVLDSSHVKAIIPDHDKSVTANSVSVINAPYTAHTTANAVVKTNVIQQHLINLANGIALDVPQLSAECFDLKSQHEKTFLNYLRGLTGSELQLNFKKFSELIQDRAERDFESLYMLAECCSKYQMKHAAIDFSTQSLNAFPTQNKVPEYLHLKHVAIIEMCGTTQLIKDYWESTPPQRKTPQLTRHVERVYKKLGVASE